jgi:hypothetical protein
MGEGGEEEEVKGRRGAGLDVRRANELRDSPFRPGKLEFQCVIGA